MTKIEIMQTRLQVLECSGLGNSPEYKALRVQIQAGASPEEYDKGPSIGLYSVCHVWGPTPRRRQKSS